MWAWLGDEAATRARRDDLWRLLGPRPQPIEPPTGRRISRPSNRPFATIERWSLTLNPGAAVPALLLRPPRGTPLRGLVLYNHAHGNRFDLGGDELLVGRPALQSPPYGQLLPPRGWAVLAIDHWGFGARQAPLGERALNKGLLWQGRTLWGWRLHDTLQALAWARTQRDLARVPVATLGLSMGATMALWAAALEPSIAASAGLCASAEYAALLTSGGFDLHAEYFFVPGLLTEFTLAEIAALIAPRPHLSCAGRDDPLTPPDGLATLDASLCEAYAALGAAANWQQHVEPVGHTETAAMRAAVLGWLDRLQP